MDFVDRLKETLEETADWNPVVSVSRKDLERLIADYEKLKERES